MTHGRSDLDASASLPKDPTCVALIPARSGSRRVPGKNVRPLAGHPLLAYTIGAALESGVFGTVIVSTESESVSQTAMAYGAEVPFLRPGDLASDTSPDIDWVRHGLRWLAERGRRWDCFALLRPTSPFRRADTIRRAWQAFLDDGQADSLRAVQPCREHPAKMWTVEGSRMYPVMPNPDPSGTPWHSMPYQSLPRIHVQNASLEIARCAVPLGQGTIAGSQILPFVTRDLEGFDINDEEDWWLAEHHAARQPGALPTVGAAR